MFAIAYPRDISWKSGRLWFIDSFDWDTVVIPHNTTLILDFRLELCTGFFPCMLSIKGEPHDNSTMLWTANSSIACSSTMGCLGVELELFNLKCGFELSSEPAIQIQGSFLRVVNSSFAGCSSLSDGAVINSFDQAETNISSSRFIDLHSAAFGGAISAVGSSIYLQNSDFVNCTSQSGGGAIWASSYQGCYGSTDSQNSTIIISSCFFQRCSTNGKGGAILSSPDSVTLGNVNVNIYVDNSHFVQCQSNVSGGALSIVSGSELALINSVLRENSVAGLGGGALHLKNAFLLLCTSLFILNVASSGGGGAVFFEENTSPSKYFQCPNNTEKVDSVIGWGDSESGYAFKNDLGWTSCVNEPILSSRRFFEGVEVNSALVPIWPRNPQMHRLFYVNGSNKSLINYSGSSVSNSISYQYFDQGICCVENQALYGSCFASDYRSLQVLEIPNGSSSAYPGLQFQLVALKKDAFNQTIVSDSSSLLQAVQVSENHIHWNSSSSITDPSQSSLTFLGSTLAQFQIGRALFLFALKPTFIEINFNTGNTAMSSTPLLMLKGVDVQSNNEMQSKHFAIEMWGGKRVCPSGYILSLDIAVEQKGPAVCKFCQAGTYSVNPLASLPGSNLSAPSCLNCPAGGNCIEGGSRVIFAVGSWIQMQGMYKLISCPPGYQLINSSVGVFSHDDQQCKACTMEQYIVNPDSSVCRTCPKGAVCPSDLSCALRNPPQFLCDGADQILGSWSLDSIGSEYVLVDCPAGYTLLSTAKAGSAELQECQKCAANQYIVHPNADDCQNCPVGALCSDGQTCALHDVPAFMCPNAERIKGEWKVSGSIYRLVNCPAGTQLLNSSSGTSSGVFSPDIQQCRPCLNGTYIINPNNDECQQCPPGSSCFIIILLRVAQISVSEKFVSSSDIRTYTMHKSILLYVV